ncbi:uncharacterized protein CTRU02_213116 [Colletotrichum truncatum]|uniref:Uncharacterized protein n=1 Tax=Colletotrichum truncatum TaxID=5467 RepID=A0ACC3YJT6_COLTU|nr:uncharacterized protein CTRU02_03438 [Colletotrichum truncatum]KAF6797407.1 hypothetical protein CTRU02_03438 [Colletotrichum truncatum]
MRASIFCSLSLCFVSVIAHKDGLASGLVARQTTDAQIIVAYSSTGQCFDYFKNGDRDKSLAPCKIWCKDKGSENYGCKGSGIPREKWDKSLIYKDEAGNEWVPGKCECNFEIAEEILGIVVEALENVDKIICAAMLESFNTILQVGITAVVPGAPAVRAAVTGAKTFLENGLDAASFFGNWVGKACDVPSWDFDLFAVFNPLTNAPDSIGKSKGCLKKNKSNCKRMEPKPDPQPSSKPDPEPSPKPDPQPTNKAAATESLEGTAQTLSPVATSAVSSASACKIGRRANDDDSQIFGEPETSTEDCGQGKTIHITSTSKNMGFYEQEVPMTCSKQWTQACYHYRSVMSVHTNTPDMVRWTCGATGGTSQTGKATDKWGSIGIGRIVRNAQHWFPWVNGFVARTTLGDPNDKTPKFKGCERDEWPPRYFWPGDTKANKKKLVQRIRLIEWHENGGAGSMFKGFCHNNNASYLKADQKLYLQREYVRTIGQARVEPPDAKQNPPTIVSHVSIDTMRAVFTIKDWDGLPEEKDGAPKWDGLKENKCWPSLLAPEDPGFALLTNDEFYQQGQHPELAHHTPGYRGLPDLRVLKKVLEDLNDEPPWPYSSIDIDTFNKRAFDARMIPDEYRGVLPGIPAPPNAVQSSDAVQSSGAVQPSDQAQSSNAVQSSKPLVVPHVVRRNVTEFTEDDSDDFEWADLDVDVDDFNDQELDLWIEKYTELVKRRIARGSGRTSPQVAIAQPTPVVNIRTLTTMAVEASRLTPEMPKATQSLG